MAEMQQLVEPPKAGRAELEEEEDNVADFLEANSCTAPPYFAESCPSSDICQQLKVWLVVLNVHSRVL